jgi:predicted ribosome quality control (RQC) complex YloA/Tae2 family protein
VVQPDAVSVVVTLYGRDPVADVSAKRHLLLSAHPEFGRVSLIGRMPQAPERPPAFSSFLRARLGAARLERASIRGDDRQLVLRFAAREARFDLLVSLLGNRSNLYVLDEEQKVVAALRPLEKTRRALAIGQAWQDPPPREGDEGEDRWHASDDADFLRDVEQVYAARASESEEAQQARHLAQALRKERKLAERRLARIEQDLAEAEQAPVLQRHGELLKGALGQIGAGDREVRVRDWETGDEVAIPIDPAKSPKQNLEATFKRYQKLVRRLTKAGGQVDLARERVEEIGTLERQLEAAESASDSAALESLVAKPEVKRLLGKHAPKSTPAPASEKPRKQGRFADLPRRLQPRRYRSRDGLEIWVGRSDEGNDHLTTRLASGNDLFFHLDGAPGSHVVLRTEGRSDPPQESVLDACELAVEFSKHKKATRADVHVVPIKQVKKPKGAKRGLVWVTGGKSVHLRREETRLERLFASRIDD